MPNPRPLGGFKELMMQIQTILNNLTLQQAQEWQATSEKYLYIDYEVVSNYGISLNNLPNNNLIEAIEQQFENLLQGVSP